MFTKQKETILINDLSELTTEIEHELYQSRGDIVACFTLSGPDNKAVLEAMRRLRSILVPVAVRIDMADPVRAMMSFLDAVDLTADITFGDIPEEGILRFGREPYERLQQRVREIAFKKDITVKLPQLLTL